MFNYKKDEFERTEKLPIYIKGKEILDLVCQIAELIPEENKHLIHIKQFMMEDAYMLTAKIVNAEGGDLYSIRMENAAIIRKAAQSLMLHNHSLEMFGFEHVGYYKMVRTLIEEYRLLFIDWVANFDKSNFVVDRWGLFNPPGVGPFDEDSDDEPMDDDDFNNFIEDDE
jgi:hypothetical protein